MNVRCSVRTVLVRSRNTNSCIANSEYEPEDMLKAVLHALASSETSASRFLVVLVLPVWDDTPWNSASVWGHNNMATLNRIPTGHMRFVPAHRQSDDMTAALPSAKWPVELVLISNEAGREKYLDQSRIPGILAPAIQTICHMTLAQTKFFPLKTFTSTGSLPQQGRHPTRPIPKCPSTMPTTWSLTPITPPWGQYSGPSSSYIPNPGRIRPHRLPREPLRIVELFGSLATGLEALLRAGYAIHSFVWVEIDPDAHIDVPHHNTHLRHQFPHLLPPKAIKDWDSQLPMDARTISLELFRATFLEGIDLLLASPPMIASHLPRPRRERASMGPDVVRHIYRLIYYLSEAHPEGVNTFGVSLSFIPHLQTPCQY